MNLELTVQGYQLLAGPVVLLVYAMAVRIARRRRVREHRVAAGLLTTMTFLFAGARVVWRLWLADGGSSCGLALDWGEALLLAASTGWLLRILGGRPARPIGRKASSPGSCRQIRFGSRGPESSSNGSSKGFSSMASVLRERRPKRVEAERPAS